MFKKEPTTSLRQPPVDNGRRSFFKKLGAAVLAVTTTSAQLKAKEFEEITRYEKKFRENSLPERPLAASGYATGIMMSGISLHCSGRLSPKEWNSRFTMMSG